MASGVYLIRCVPSGKVYVGSSKDLTQRMSCHKSLLRGGRHHSRRLQRSWDKYGEAAFVFEVVLVCEADQLAVNEQAHIDEYDSYWNGFNGTPFAYTALGRTHSDETKNKLSAIGLGRPHTESHKANIAKALKGNKNAEGCVVSAENRAKLAERNIGNTYGAGKRSEEWCEKLSRRNIGNSYARAQKGIPKSDEAKAKMSISQRLRRERERAHLSSSK